MDDYDPGGLSLYFAFVWLVSMVVAPILGADKNSGTAAFTIALFFGPLGIIVAPLMDGRPRCPKCWERVYRGCGTCPHCDIDLVAHWKSHRSLAGMAADDIAGRMKAH